MTWIFHCIHFHSLHSFHLCLLVELCSFNYWNPAGWNVSSWALSSFELLFSEVFNDFNCCSCTSLSLTLDNARLPLQNLCTNLTQVHLYANFQEGKIALLTPWEQSAFICYLLTAPHIKCFKNPLKQNQMFTEILTSVQIKLSSSLPPNSLYPLNNALKWKYRACNDWQN